MTATSEQIQQLLGDSREDGSQRHLALPDGLKVTVSTYPEEYIALSRPGSVPAADEAAQIAQAAGWDWYSTDWQSHKGQRYLLLKPSDPDVMEAIQAAEPPPVIPQQVAAVPPAKPYWPNDEWIRMLLLTRDAAWRQRTFSSDQHEMRDAAIRAMKTDELREDFDWVRRKFPAAYTAYLSEHPW